jgi:glycerol uptake facilitator protein
VEIFIAEMVGTALLVLLGDGVVANHLLRDTKGNATGWVMITTGWAMAVALRSTRSGASRAVTSIPR